MALNKNDVGALIDALASGLQSLPEAKHNAIDPTKEVEVQTDKDLVKLVGCRDCQRPLVVTTFFAPAKAICRVCKGEMPGGDRTASVGQPIPGQTDPAKAVNLADCLINKQFATAVCPLCTEEMELKSISHAENYGPRHLKGYDKGGIPQYDQTTGETAMLQCNSCKCVVSMSTQHQHSYLRQNEPKDARHVHGSAWSSLLGERDPDQVAA